MRVKAILRQLFESHPVLICRKPFATGKNVVFTIVISTLVHATQTDLCTASLEGHRVIVSGRNHNLSVSICEPILVVFYKSHQTVVQLVGAIVERGDASNDSLSTAIHVHPSVRSAHTCKALRVIT